MSQPSCTPQKLCKRVFFNNEGHKMAEIIPVQDGQYTDWKLVLHFAYTSDTEEYKYEEYKYAYEVLKHKFYSPF